MNLTYNSLSQVRTEEQWSDPLGSTGSAPTHSWSAEFERSKVSISSGFEARETRDEPEGAGSALGFASTRGGAVMDGRGVSPKGKAARRRIATAVLGAPDARADRMAEREAIHAELEERGLIRRTRGGGDLLSPKPEIRS